MLQCFKFKVQGLKFKVDLLKLFAFCFSLIPIKNYDILLTKFCFILPIFVFARKFAHKKNRLWE